MPRKAKSSENGENKILRVVSNQYTAEQAIDFVNRFENLDDDIAAVMRQARNNCQAFKDDQKALRKEAAEGGIPKKVFAAALRERKLERQKLAVPFSLNDEAKDDLETLRSKLGALAETPLGQHALSA